MKKEYLIVGHGIAGCVLALSFLKKKIPFRLAGISQPGEASMASSGLITPVTGRKYVKSWMIDQFIESALEFYRWTEDLLGNKFFHQVDIVRFLSNHEALTAWEKRSIDPEYGPYISNKKYEALDQLQKPYGILTGGYRLNTPGWIHSARTYLAELGMFEERMYSLEDLYPEFDSVIYATGAVGTSVSKGLIPNKGEALVVNMKNWKYPAIIKEDVFFIPLEDSDTFWIGSYYEPWPEDPEPTLVGRKTLMQAIEKVYSGSFKVNSHLSGIRPTVDDRRPLVGRFPQYENKYLFNGMGTKGTSLAPFWADHLISHLIEGKPILPIVDPARYSQQSG